MVEPAAAVVEASDALVLIADFLERSTPCSRAARALREEIGEHGLLGAALRWNDDDDKEGGEEERVAPFPAVPPSVPADHLLTQLGTALTASSRSSSRRSGENEESSRLGEAARIVETESSPRSVWWSPDPELSEVASVEDAMRRIARAPRELRECKSELAKLDRLEAWERGETEEALTPPISAEAGSSSLPILSDDEEEKNEEPSHALLLGSWAAPAQQSKRAESPTTTVFHARLVERESRRFELESRVEKLEILVESGLEAVPGLEREKFRRLAALLRRTARGIDRWLDNRSSRGILQLLDNWTCSFHASFASPSKMWEPARAVVGIAPLVEHSTCDTADDRLQWRDGNRRAVDARLGQRATLWGHRGYSVYCVAFDVLGEFVVTGADDYLVKVWHAASARLRATMRGHRSVVTDIAVSPDNVTVASASQDGTARIWRLRDGKCVAVLTIGPPKPLHVATDATRSASLCAIEALEFDSCRGSLYALGKQYSDVRCWDVRAIVDASARGVSGAEWDRLVSGACLPHDDTIKSLAVASTGAYLATGADDGTVCLWQCIGDFNSAEVSQLVDTEAALRNAFETQGSETLQQQIDDDAGAVGRRAAQIRILQHKLAKARYELLSTFLLFTQVDAHDDAVTDLSFSKLNDRLLSACGSDCTVSIWSWAFYDDGGAKIGRVGLDLISEEKNVTSSSTGADSSGAPGDSRRTGTNSVTGSKTLVSVAWNCDDTLVLTSTFRMKRGRRDEDAEQRVGVFDSIDGTRLRSFEAHAHDRCYCLSPHPFDPFCLLTGGHDRTLRLWNLTEMKQPLTHDFFAATSNGVVAQRGTGNVLGGRREESGVEPRLAAGAAAEDRASTINQQQQQQQNLEPQNAHNAPSTTHYPNRRFGNFTKASSASEPGQFWSACWSRDGARFAVVDLLGQLHLFGPKGNSEAENSPQEQYLASDYAELAWDPNGYAVDAATRVQPHLAPREFFRNYLAASGAVAAPPGSSTAMRRAEAFTPPLVDAREAPHRDSNGEWVWSEHRAPLAVCDDGARRARLESKQRTLTDWVQASKVSGVTNTGRAQLTTQESGANAAAIAFATSRWWWPKQRVLRPVGLTTRLSAPPQRHVNHQPARSGVVRVTGLGEQWVTVDSDDENANGVDVDLDDLEDADFGEDDARDDDEDEEDDDEEGDDELAEENIRPQPRNRLRRRRRVAASDSDELNDDLNFNDIVDDDEDETRITRSIAARNANGTRLGGSSNGRAPRRRLLGAAAAQRAASSNNARRRRMREDEDDDEYVETRRRRETSRRRRVRNNNRDRRRERVRVSDEDSLEEDENEENSEEPVLESDDSSEQRGVSDENEETDEDDIIVLEDRPPPPPKIESSVVIGDWARLHRVPQHSEKDSLLYVPQEGDEIVYVPEGHAAHVAFVGDDALDDQGAPWRTVPALARLVSQGGHGVFVCRVEEVTYQNPGKRQPIRSIIANIKLVATAVCTDVTDPLCVDFVPISEAIRHLDEIAMPRRSTRTKTAQDDRRYDSGIPFTVLFRQCDAADFVVLRFKYEYTVRRRELCEIGARATLPMVEGPFCTRYPGTISICTLRPGSESAENPHALIDADDLGDPVWDTEGLESDAASCWEQLEITMEDGSKEKCSPWELEPPGEGDMADMDMINPPVASLASDIVAVLVAGVEKVFHHDEFRDPVLEQHPDLATSYLAKVAAPIELRLIRERLVNGYYRHIEAFEGDARRLALNTSCYNGANTYISDLAESISDALLQSAASARSLLNVGNDSGNEDEAFSEVGEEGPTPPSRASRKRRRERRSSGDGDDSGDRNSTSATAVRRPLRAKRVARRRTAGAGGLRP